MTNQLYQYAGGQLIPIDSSLGIELQVADTWLVEDGKVRSLGLHFQRFENSVAEIAPELGNEVSQFLETVKNFLPLDGLWAPRVELHASSPSGNRLHLRMTDAPALLGPATLITIAEPDPRLNPSTKGPDLALGMQLRRKANMLGADDAVIVDASGFICEGVLSSLVWWRGEVLVAPNSETAWIDSVTRKEIFAIAEQMGLSTRVEKAKPADLVETEVWLLSSLQGIRPVTDWLDLGGPLAAPTHVESFNKRLRLLATAIR